MLSGSVMPPSTDTLHGLGGDLPLAVSGEKSITARLQKLTQLSVNINAMSLKKNHPVWFVYQANQDCYHFICQLEAHTKLYTHPCSDCLSAHSQRQWASQGNTHLVAQFLYVLLPLSHDSKALNISDVSRQVCNTVTLIRFTCPLSLHTLGLCFERPETKG